jgi:hypothetical protein
LAHKHTTSCQRLLVFPVGAAVRLRLAGGEELMLWPVRPNAGHPSTLSSAPGYLSTGCQHSTVGSVAPGTAREFTVPLLRVLVFVTLAHHRIHKYPSTSGHLAACKKVEQHIAIVACREWTFTNTYALPVRVTTREPPPPSKAGFELSKWQTCLPRAPFVGQARHTSRVAASAATQGGHDARCAKRMGAGAPLLRKFSET